MGQIREMIELPLRHPTLLLGEGAHRASRVDVGLWRCGRCRSWRSKRPRNTSKNTSHDLQSDLFGVSK